MKTFNLKSQQELTPQQALQYLQEGNERFVNNLKAHRDLLEQVNDTRAGQWPFATVLSCMDSRTSVELIFDQGLGDVFSIRIAGNIINDDIVGSLEYACKVANSKVILVLGHSQCGAIYSACKGVQLGNITSLLDKIKPAIVQAKRNINDHLSFEEEVAHYNVDNSINILLEKSLILREMLEQKQIILVGGMYNIETGEVEFFKPIDLH